MKVSKYINAGYKYVTDSRYRFSINNGIGLYKRWSDEKYLSYAFLKIMGKPLDLENPKTFNEKLQWLKLHDRKPEHTIMVDKYRVREYIADKLGEEYLIPLLGVWDDPDDIDFDALPDQFVLKCNHNSGTGMCICKDKSKLDIAKVRTDLRRGLKEDYFIRYREWPYKDVPRKIIAEKYMVDNATKELRDYKFFCFGGVCKCMKVDFDRFIHHRANYYDTEGNILDFGEAVCPPNPQKSICLPKNTGKMINLAEKLSEGQPFMRADFYDANGDVYFGEITFFPASGFGKFIPDEWDYKLGEWIKLPERGGVLLLLNDLIIIYKDREANRDLIDYKFFCFNGTPQFCQVITNRSTDERIDFFDMEWRHQNFVGLNSYNCRYKNSDDTILRPINFEKMKIFAQKLSVGTQFIRVDLYEINRKLYFGELTFYPASGFGWFEPDEWNYKLGKMINLGIC